MATIANAMKGVILSSTSKTQGGSGSAALNDTDLVQLYDNAGNPNGKITKSALMDAVKASLPAILSDQTTTGVNFPSINGSGVLGKMTAANLASVLGGRTVQVNSSSNLNDCTQIGVKYVWAAQRPVNIPSNIAITHGMSFVMPTDTTDCLIQYAVSRNVKAVCIRFREGDVWNAWQRIDNYGTSSLSELALVLGARNQFAGNIDELLSDGHYYVINKQATGTIPTKVDLGTTEYISNYTLDVTSVPGQNMKRQTINDFNTKMILERWKVGNNSWGNWEIIYTDAMLSNSKQMGSLASVLGVIAEKEIMVGGLSSTTVPNATTCSIFVWCVRGASFAVGIAVIENETVSYIRNGLGTVSFSKATRNITLTFENTLSAGCKLHYWLYAFEN